MSLNLVVFLAGLFAVPLILVWWGQKLRRLTERRRRAFWGAVFGHCVAGTFAIVAGMIPPEAWTSSEVIRGVVGFWAMVLFPVLGALGALLVSPQHRAGVRDH